MWCLHGNNVVFTCKSCSVHIWIHVLSTWKPHVVHMETTWYPHVNQVVSTEKPCGVNAVTTLCPHVYKNHMVSKYHVETMLFSCWHNMVTMLTPHGFQVYTTWFAWTACGFHVDTMWFPCRPHVVSRWIPHHFQITSVANWSQKLTNLWKPVTSLIMVWFSIRKKFWKALGLLYQLVLFYVISTWKWPHHFPFGQISLQSHVTTLNQPIRSLNSLKSPSSRRHFCDFVRFHPKFHPHLKSKAVRTALLKTGGSRPSPYMEKIGR